MGNIAINLIEQNKLTREKRLDLGNCSLKIFPKELYDCKWIEELILSSHWWDYDKMCWIASANEGNANHITVIPEDIYQLSFLKVLIMNNGISQVRSKLWGTKNLELLRNLETLDLSFYRLNHMKNIPLIPSLKNLYLSGTNVLSYAHLSSLKKLQTLDLSYNIHKRVRFFKDMDNLDVLYLDHCRFDRPELLKRLPPVQKLSLNHCNLTDITFISSLTELYELDISENEIADHSPFRELPRLQVLHLGGTNIPDISFVESMPGLRKLDLRGASIADPVPLGKLTELTELDISLCPLPGFDFLKGLIKVQRLSLRYNRLSDLSALSGLTSLKEIDLRFNAITEPLQLYPLTLLNANLRVDLQNNEVIEKMPGNVLKAGWPAVRDRVISLFEKESFEQIAEVKLLLLGNPNVGKSNLLEYLETGKEPTSDVPTHGLQYRRLENLIDGININCWDFGGDEYFHATHRLFFSPGALSVILWSVKDIKRHPEDMSFGLDYWLRGLDRIVNTFYGVSKRTEAILCENKIDLQGGRPTPLDQTSYENKFHQLQLSYGHLNLKPLRYTASFKELLSERAPLLVDRYQRRYRDYIKLIQASDSPYLLVKEIDPDRPEIRETALMIFHYMGILLYFPNLIPEKVFIKPQILLDFLYNRILTPTMLDDKKFSLTVNDLTDAIKDNQLDLSVSELISLLKNFDLVFQIPQKAESYFFPQYMPALPPVMDEWISELYGKPALLIRSDYYLLNIVMLKIFSKYGQHAKVDADSQFLFWKDKIVLELSGSRVLVQLERATNTIQISGQKDSDSFYASKEIVEFILGINFGNNENESGQEDENGISIRKRQSMDWADDRFSIFLCDANGYWVKWNDLVGIAEIKGTEVIAYSSLSDLDNNQGKKLSRLAGLEAYIPEHIRKPKARSVFISYSHRNSHQKKELLKFLRNLIHDEKIEVWDDGLIQAGEIWDESIKANLIKADINILLVSQDLIDSTYVNEVEFRLILEMQAKKNAHVIPIILENCDWENWKVRYEGKTMASRYDSIHPFQLLPLNSKRELRPLNKWKFKGDAWMQVVTTIQNL